MGFISGLFNGSKGSNFDAAQAPLINAYNADQATHTYNQSQDAYAQQQQFLNALNAQNGIGNQNLAIQQLQGIANGTGPNPAQAMLNNATGQNIAATTAAMAGQRGSSANTGLIARQAGMAGANLQQQSVGQAANLQANQGLNAINAGANIAGQQVANQANAVGALNSTAQGNQSLVNSGIANQNNANVSNSSQANAANSAIAAQNAKNQGSLLSGAAGAIGTGIQTLMSPGFASGGEVGPRSKVAIHLKGGGTPKMEMQQGTQAPVPVKLSPGEKVLSPKQAEAVADGKVSPAKVGKIVPGKAEKPGNDPANDTVSAKADPGSIVIPLSVMQSDDPVKGTIAFVRAHMRSQMTKKKTA